MRNKYQRVISFLLILFVYVSGCSKAKQSTVNEQNSAKPEIVQQQEYGDELIEVDVTKQYPKIDIRLEDIADVELISLETNDDFVCNGETVALTDSFIIFMNRGQEGSISVFDAMGKAKKRFNHKGLSGKEYAGISRVLWDERNKELYINDMWTKRILVYDLDGNHKRHFYHAKGQYLEIGNYSDSNLICHDRYGVGGIYPDDKFIKNPFTIVSKRTGRNIQDIDIPFKEKLTLAVGDGHRPNMEHLFKLGEKFIVVELSSDTIYSVSENGKLLPVIVRNPPIQTMNVPIFLIIRLVTTRYVFMLSIKKEFDEKTRKGYPGAALVYDRKDKKIYEYSLSYQDTKLSFASFPVIRPLCATNNQDTYVGELPAYLLKQKEEENELAGSLQELASRMNEEDNPVVMKITFKQ